MKHLIHVLILIGSLALSASAQAQQPLVQGGDTIACHHLDSLLDAGGNLLVTFNSGGAIYDAGGALHYTLNSSTGVLTDLNGDLIGTISSGGDVKDGNNSLLGTVSGGEARDSNNDLLGTYGTTPMQRAGYYFFFFLNEEGL